MRAVEAAAALIAALVAEGVRDVVLSPGSRSAPLAYAIEQAERDALLRLHVRHDERTAAFLALGCGKAEPAHPAAVVTTSGTAVANLLPAVLEARHAAVPLLLLTADRPPRLRGTWANQTSDLQAGLLSEVSLAAWDVEPAELSPAELLDLAVAAVATARGEPRRLEGERAGGPVHLNLCFDNPLQPQPGEAVLLPEVARRETAPADVGQAAPVMLGAGPRTVVIAGDGAGPTARGLAEQARWPLLAEPTSGARAGECLIDCYRLVAERDELAGQVERVVVLGRPTLSRPVTALIDRPEVEVVHVVRDSAEPGPACATRRVAAVVAAAADDPQWLAAWRQAGEQARARLGECEQAWPRVSGPRLAEAVAAATRGDDALVLGASNPVRDVDLAAGALADGALVLANRGLAGIDGTVSTALGVAVASGRATRALIGDLTFLHDLAGLAMPAAERDRVRLQVIVLNDDGGGIFETLEHGEHQQPFERVFGTPVGADLAALVTGFGARHRLVRDLTQLPELLAEVPGGIEVLEVASDRAALRDFTMALSRP